MLWPNSRLESTIEFCTPITPHTPQLTQACWHVITRPETWLGEKIIIQERSSNLTHDYENAPALTNHELTERMWQCTLHECIYVKKTNKTLNPSYFESVTNTYSSKFGRGELYQNYLAKKKFGNKKIVSGLEKIYIYSHCLGEQTWRQTKQQTQMGLDSKSTSPERVGCSAWHHHTRSATKSISLTKRASS